MELSLACKNKAWRAFIFFLSLIWLSWGVYCLGSFSHNNFETDKALFGLSLDDKRALVTGREFYGFLKDCERAIPPDKSLRGIFVGADKGETEFYYYRSYYFLFPRNFTQDADYIILYNLGTEGIPAGYKLAARFGPNKSILEKTGKAGE